ncbi:MAG TPA: cytochrome b [Gammaproteobacteria bacterium]|nr:cytochrome b [Gammaproteobacteria bacterium]
MRWKNTTSSWGWISILFHWLSALVIVGLFALGLWMVELTYYDDWYRTAPDIHRSIGVLLLIATVLRLLWRRMNVVPAVLPTHKTWEIKSAHIAHTVMYILLVAIFISGYLISTADGRGVQVFGWFEIPATLHGIKNQEDIAGEIHLVLAVSLIALAVIHAAGALKHHVIDRDNTLKRMLGK